MKSVQVYEGWYDPKQEIAKERRRILGELNLLVQDLYVSAQYIKTPAAVSNRLLFIDKMREYLEDKTTWSMAVQAYRDLADLSDYYTKLGSHDTIVMRIVNLMSEISSLRATSAAA